MAAVTSTMTPARDLWSEAAATLSNEDKEYLSVEKFSKGSISSSILQMTEQKKAESDQQLWSFSFDGKKILVRDVLQSILNWTKKFQQVAEFVVGLDVSGHAAIPWSAIKFFLDVAGKDLEKYGAMLVGMEFVTREIHFYTIFEVIYLKKPSEVTEMLSQSLIKTYAKLLGYLANAKRYYSQSTFKRAIKAPFDDGGVDGMMTDVGNNRPFIEREAGLLDRQGLDSVLSAQSELREELKNWTAPLESISLQVTEIYDTTKIAKTKEILDWISPIRYEMHHENAKKELLENSGGWLLDHNDFRQWKDSPKSSILWLEGIPGSGKTTLSSLVVETLRDTAGENLNSVAYFYCMRDTAEPERGDATQILKCIARQLAYNTTASAVKPAAIKKYEELTEGGLRFKELDLEQSATLIIDLTEGLASVTIIVDAMDECDDIPSLLEKLTWILQKAKIPIRIFIASRNEKKISIRLEGLPSSKIEIGENSGDIELFVRTEVDRAISKKILLSGEVSPETKQKIIETLIAGAQGMFRWASLQLQSLTKLKNEANVIKDLSQLPKGLSDIYAKIYRQMSETDTFEIAVKALRFLACSQKSIPTSAFLTAICPPPQKPIDSESLLDYCFNLIVEDKTLGIFRFAHLSVREYLETHDGYTPIDTHAVAAEICLTCITKTRARPHSRVTVQNTEQPPDPMVEYATLFWPLHCGLSGEKRDVAPLAPPISSFILQKRVGNAFSKWMEDARTLAKCLSARNLLGSKLRHSFCSPPNPFFLACVFGLHEVVERSAMSVTEKSESGLNGLHLASMYGHEKVVQILLGKGAGADSKDTYGRTPLFYATKYGHSSIIELLLDHDKDIDISPDILYNAAFASRRGQLGKNIFELLLSRGSKVDGSYDVIFTAIAAPTKDLIECLWNLPQGIEISQSLFDGAACNHSTEVLNFLLDLSEENTFEITSRTLENSMMDQPGTETLELLLEFYTESQIDEKVIMTAASFGGLEHFKVLVDYGINKGIEIPISQDVFEAAANNPSAGSIQLMEFLRGTNTSLQITTKVIASAAGNENHEQALQMVQYLHAQNLEAEITEDVVKKAISSGNGDLLKYLLDTFKQLKVTRELVKTAAGFSDGIDLVEVLLALNPEIQVDEELLEIAAEWADKPAMTSLFDQSKVSQATEKMVIRAAKWMSPETIDFLITKAADLQITDTIIMAAIEGRHGDLEKEVLQVFCNHAKDFKPTEDVAIAAAKADEAIEYLGYLIARYGSVPITDAVWKAATCNLFGPAIEFLLGQDVKPRDMESVIASTAALGLVREVELLLSQAGKEIDSEKWLGVANLSFAIRDSEVKKVQELVSKGVWPDTKHTEMGWTTSMMAAKMGNEEIVKALLETGKVDLEMRDKDGKTSLFWAAEMGHKGVVKILLEAGADWKAVDLKNETAVMSAAAGGHLDTCEVFKQWEARIAGDTQL